MKKLSYILFLNCYLLYVADAQIGPVTKFRSKSDFPNMKLRIIFEQPNSTSEIFQYKLKLEVLTEPGDCYLQYYLKCGDCSGSNIGSGKENQTIIDCKGNNISKEEFYFNKNDKEIDIILDDEKLLPNLKFNVYIYAGDSYGWGQESLRFSADILGYPPHCPNVNLECNNETIIVNVSKSPDYDGKSVSKYVTRFVKNDTCEYSISTTCRDCGTNNFGRYDEQTQCVNNSETTFSKHDQVMSHNVSSSQFNESKITVYSVNSERWSINCTSHECSNTTTPPINTTTPPTIIDCRKYNIVCIFFTLCSFILFCVHCGYFIYNVKKQKPSKKTTKTDQIKQS